MSLEESICLFLMNHLQENGVPIQQVRVMLRLLNMRKLLSSSDFNLHQCLVEVNEILQSWGFKPKKDISDEERWEKAKKAGFLYKTWYTEDDNRVREAHNNREKEKRPIDERFSRQFKEGLRPMFPRDPKAEIGDIINCRCGLKYS